MIARFSRWLLAPETYAAAERIAKLAYWSVGTVGYLYLIRALRRFA